MRLDEIIKNLKTENYSTLTDILYEIGKLTNKNDEVNVIIDELDKIESIYTYNDYKLQKDIDYLKELLREIGLSEKVVNKVINNLDKKTIYRTIEDRQGGDFGLRTQTEIQWAITAIEWSDYWAEMNADEKFFLDVFKKGKLIPFIDEHWDITIKKVEG